MALQPWPCPLKIMAYNAQDLFLNLAYELAAKDLAALSEQQWQLLAAGDAGLKPLVQLRGMAQMLDEEDPDIVCLTEVGGLESLQRFNHYFLRERYVPLLVPSHSQRGIENGFLVKKALPVAVELKTHLNWPVPFTYPHEDNPKTFAIAAAAAAYIDLGKPAERRLSRDIPALLIKSAADQDFLAILLVHLKSGFDIEGIDPGGQVRRAAELKALLAIHTALQKQLGPDIPIMIAGDFNGNASREGTAAEFLPLYQTTDLDDVLQISGKPRHERHTHVTFVSRDIRAQQLDYIFVPAALRPRLDHAGTYVHRYRFSAGEQEIMVPSSFHDRRLLPSDHYPLVCSLKPA